MTMSARDIFGLSGVIFVLASAVAMIAELTNSTASAMRAAQYAAYGVSAALLLLAGALHAGRRNASAPDAVVDDAPAEPAAVQGVPRQHAPNGRSAPAKVGSSRQSR